MIDWIQDEIARNMRNILVVNTILLLCVLAFFFGGWRDIAGLLAGPKPIQAAALKPTANAGDFANPYVQVTAAQAFNTGYQSTEETQESGSSASPNIKVTGNFYALAVGDRFLLLRAPASLASVPGSAPRTLSQLTWTGKLVPFSAPVRNTVIPGITAESPATAARMLPYMLDTVDVRSGPITLLAIGLPVLLFALWNILRAVRITGDPAQSPLWKQAMLFGQPQELSQRIGSELSLGRSYRKLTLTPNWLVHRRPFRTWISPVEDIAWAHLKIIRKTVYLIPVARFHAVVLHTRQRQTAEVRCSKEQALELLQELQRRAPWAAFGFNPDLAKAWRKSKDQFLDDVNSRRVAQTNPRSAQAIALLADLTTAQIARR